MVIEININKIDLTESTNTVSFIITFKKKVVQSKRFPSIEKNKIKKFFWSMLSTNINFISEKSPILADFGNVIVKYFEKGEFILYSSSNNQLQK